MNERGREGRGSAPVLARLLPGISFIVNVMVSSSMGCYHHYSHYAGVAEWQTRMVQVHVGATP